MVAIKTLISLAPFIVGLVAAGNDVKNWQPYTDNSQTSTHVEQGAWAGCGMSRRQTFNGGIHGNGNNGQTFCRRSELLEEHMEERDLDAGFEALDAMDKRSNNVENWSPYTDNSRSRTYASGGAIAHCRRQTFNGGISGNGNNGQTFCRRSTELAIKDIGQVYRRMVERDLTPEEAESGAEFLRRHAEELGLLEA